MSQTVDNLDWRSNLSRHIIELAKLAWPVIITRTGILTMAMADAIMVARHSTQELAYLAIGVAPTVPLVVTGVTMMMGTLVMTATAFGAAAYGRCGAIWRRSLPYALMIGCVCALVCLFGETFLLATGQTAELAAGGGRVILILGLGLPGNLLFAASNFFLEGIKRALPGMVLMVGANILNVLLNWVFIYGHAGSPELGAAGAALATSSSRWVLGIGLAVYVWNLRDRHSFAIRQRSRARRRDWADQRRLGYAAGASGATESLAFTILTLFAGLLGTYPLGAYSLSMNLLALIFMIALGMAMATAVRVGIYYGQREHREVAFAGWTGVGLSSALLGVFAAIFWLFPQALASLYSTDPELIAAAAALIAFMSLVVVTDGGQVVMAGALRGRGDAWMPVLTHFFSYFVVMLPLAWWFTFTLEHGVRGLMEAILAGTAVAMTLLMLRFRWLTRNVRPATVQELQ